MTKFMLHLIMKFFNQTVSTFDLYELLFAYASIYDFWCTEVKVSFEKDDCFSVTAKWLSLDAILWSEKCSNKLCKYRQALLLLMVTIISS